METIKQLKIEIGTIVKVLIGAHYGDTAQVTRITPTGKRVYVTFPSGYCTSYWHGDLTTNL